MNGKDGADTLVWRNGEANDVMNGGDGIDTIESNGADTASPVANEVYTADVVAGRFVFTRTSGGPFNLDVGGAEKYVNNMLGGDDRFSTADPARPVKGIAVELNGGEGNDALGGTDGDDTLNGGPGNDALVGFKGNDAMNGDDGDDLLVWNPGDGSDRFEGGAGNDTGQDNGGAGPEHFVVSAQGQRVTATRDNLAPFFLDMGTIETLDLNADGGDDSVEVENGLAALIKVDADLGDGNDRIQARNAAVDVDRRRRRHRHRARRRRRSGRQRRDRRHRRDGRRHRPATPPPRRSSSSPRSSRSPAARRACGSAARRARAPARARRRSASARRSSARSRSTSTAARRRRSRSP